MTKIDSIFQKSSNLDFLGCKITNNQKIAVFNQTSNKLPNSDSSLANFHSYWLKVQTERELLYVTTQEKT